MKQRYHQKVTKYGREFSILTQTLSFSLFICWILLFLPNSTVCSTGCFTSAVRQQNQKQRPRYGSGSGDLSANHGVRCSILSLPKTLHLSVSFLLFLLSDISSDIVGLCSSLGVCGWTPARMQLAVSVNVSIRCS